MREIRKKTDERAGVARAGKRDNPTQQQFRKACNITEILKRHKKTGLVPSNDKLPLNVAGEIFDATTVDSYQDALLKINEANQAFWSVPANIRKQFDNNPILLMEFVQNPDNREKAIEIGLIVEEKEEPKGITIKELKENFKLKEDGEKS